MTLPSFSQDGRVALVTGGRRGIGRATALAFAEAGADVAICDVAADDGLLDATAAEIRGFGRRALALPADVTSEAEVNAMVDRTRSELGRIDVLVNNAGIAGVEPALTDFGEDGNFYAVYDVTVKGTCLCTAAVAPTMIDQGGGCIVNLSSMDAFLNRGAGAYSLAKRAIVDITSEPRGTSPPWRDSAARCASTSTHCASSTGRRFGRFGHGTARNDGHALQYAGGYLEI